MYTYTNSFHNSEYRSRKSPEDLYEIERRIGQGKATDADKAFARKIKNALCGTSGCTCGDMFGRR